MPRRSIIGDDEASGINLSPMIDCIFILLIFFIVTTVFVEEQGIQVSKPDAAASSLLQEDNENVTFEITAENKIFFGDKEIGLADVAGRVKASGLDGDTSVVIRAHEKADHGTFVSVWDAARRSGAGTLSFNTIN
jgi:biopolymer transport protein ExbD